MQEEIRPRHSCDWHECNFFSDGFWIPHKQNLIKHWVCYGLLEVGNTNFSKKSQRQPGSWWIFSQDAVDPSIFGDADSIVMHECTLQAKNRRIPGYIFEARIFQSVFNHSSKQAFEVAEEHWAKAAAPCRASKRWCLRHWEWSDGHLNKSFLEGHGQISWRPFFFFPQIDQCFKAWLCVLCVPIPISPLQCFFGTVLLYVSVQVESDQPKKGCRLQQGDRYFGYCNTLHEL